MIGHRNVRPVSASHRATRLLSGRHLLMFKRPFTYYNPIFPEVVDVTGRKFQTHAKLRMPFTVNFQPTHLFNEYWVPLYPRHNSRCWRRRQSPSPYGVYISVGKTYQTDRRIDKIMLLCPCGKNYELPPRNHLSPRSVSSSLDASWAPGHAECRRCFPTSLELCMAIWLSSGPKDTSKRGLSGIRTRSERRTACLPHNRSLLLFFPVDWNVDALTRAGGAISAPAVRILEMTEQNVRRWLSPWCHVNHVSPRLFSSGLSLCVGKTHFRLFKISGFLKFSVTPTWF